jgi:polyphenol oxidase
MLEFDVLSGLADHGVTSRQLRFREPRIDEDYGVLAKRFDVSPDRVVRVRQVHGRVVRVIREGDAQTAADADAIVSTDPRLVASVRIADCVPVLIADRGQRVVAAVHAGWRGTAAGVTSETVKAISALGVAPTDLIAAIGPSIGPCCYQVSGDVRDTMRGSWPGPDAWFAEDGVGRWKLDLWRANRDQLQSAGVRPDSIVGSNLCTADHLDRFYSHRREGSETGRMVAAIRLRGRPVDQSR